MGANKFPGTCETCGAHVPAGSGTCSKRPSQGRGWVVRCKACADKKDERRNKPKDNNGIEQYIVERATIAEIMADSREPYQDNAKCHKEYALSGDTSWLGETIETVMSMKHNGLSWPSGLARITREASTMPMPVPLSQSFRRQRHRREFGDDLLVDRLYNGNLDTCWETRRRTTRANSVKRVVIDICATASTRSDQMFWRGVAAAALANTLKSSGASVELSVAWATREPFSDFGPKSRYACAVKVFGFGESINMETLATVTGLAGFWRAFCWRYWCGVPRRLDYGLGWPCDLPEGMFPEDTYIVPRSILSRADAVTWVESQRERIERDF